MNAPPLISVILPFWNAETTLAEAIQSIQKQTVQDWELVLFDDGSTDRSGEIARAFQAMDARIRVIASEHVGIVAGLNRACSEARGEFLARMDADDIAAPERLARQLACLQGDASLWLCGAQVRISGPRITVGQRRYEAWLNALTTPEAIVRELFIECPIAHPVFFFRRATWARLGGYHAVDWPEDYDFCMRIFAAGGCFANVPAPLLEWRDAPGRLSRTSSRYSPEAFRAIKRHYLRLTYLRGRERFHQWGGGEIGKLWLREWDAWRPEAVVDINLKKIGGMLHGYRVIPPDALPAPGETFTLIAVGAPGARDIIRSWLTPRGYRECVDYLFLA